MFYLFFVILHFGDGGEHFYFFLFFLYLGWYAIQCMQCVYPTYRSIHMYRMWCCRVATLHCLLQVALLKDVLEEWKREVDKKPPEMSVDQAYDALGLKTGVGG